MADKRPAARPSNMLMGMAQRVAPRIGEGQPVQLLRVTKSSDNKTVSFGADFSKAPVPTRRYAADICDVIESRNDVVIVFGQESVYNGEVDSVLQLRMNPTSARAFLESMDTKPGSTFEDTVSRLNVKDEALTPIKARPSKEAKAVVSFASVAMSGFDSCIDFYSASPFAMAHLQDNGELFVEPIARVDLHSALFVSLVKKLREIVPTLQQLKEERTK